MRVKREVYVKFIIIKRKIEKCNYWCLESFEILALGKIFNLLIGTY